MLNPKKYQINNNNGIFQKMSQKIKFNAIKNSKIIQIFKIRKSKNKTTLLIKILKIQNKLKFDFKLANNKKKINTLQ